MNKDLFKNIKYFKPINNRGLGEGGFAEVILVKHIKHLDKVYAMKVLKKEPKSEIPFIEREITIHKNLDFPYIIRFEGYIEDKNNYYLFMEYA